MKLFGASRATQHWLTEAEKPAPPRAIPLQGLMAWSVFGLFLMALLTAMYFVQAILMPVVAAAVVAVIFSPVMRWLERRGLPSNASALLIIVGFILAVAAAATAVVPTVREMSAQLPQMAARIEFNLADIRASLKSLKEVRDKFDKATKVGEAQKPNVSGEAPPSPGGGVAEVLFQIGLFAVLTFFFLASRRVYRRRIILAQSTQMTRLKVARILRDMGNRVSTYLFTVSMINIALGITVGAALALLGMPAAIVLGFAVIILNFVPVVGPILVIAATAALSLATFDDWGLIIAAPGIVLVLHLIESQVVSPWLVGRRLEMSPLAVFGGIALLGWMWGAVGAMIAVPLLILLYTFGQHIPVLSPLASWIGPTEGDVDDEIDEGTNLKPDSPDPGPLQPAAELGAVPLPLATPDPIGSRP
jgi:predicted PurR-regulated permease PerM